VAGAIASVRVTERISAAEKAMDALLEAAVAKVALTIEAGGKMRAPIDTGHLRNSIQARPVGSATWEVVAQAHYAVYVEMGTRYMRARPFLGPAVEDARRAVSGLQGLTLGGWMGL
jgi:HK97 gp10 family phage protein